MNSLYLTNGLFLSLGVVLVRLVYPSKAKRQQEALEAVRLDKEAKDAKEQAEDLKRKAIKNLEDSLPEGFLICRAFSISTHISTWYDASGVCFLTQKPIDLFCGSFDSLKADGLYIARRIALGPFLFREEYEAVFYLNDEMSLDDYKFLTKLICEVRNWNNKQ